MQQKYELRLGTIYAISLAYRDHIDHCTHIKAHGYE
jgi:hypothetical protein